MRMHVLLEISLSTLVIVHHGLCNSTRTIKNIIEIKIRIENKRMSSISFSNNPAPLWKSNILNNRWKPVSEELVGLFSLNSLFVNIKLSSPWVY